MTSFQATLFAGANWARAVEVGQIEFATFPEAGWRIDIDDGQEPGLAIIIDVRGGDREGQPLEVLASRDH